MQFEIYSVFSMFCGGCVGVVLEAILVKLDKKGKSIHVTFPFWKEDVRKNNRNWLHLADSSELKVAFTQGSNKLQSYLEIMGFVNSLAVSHTLRWDEINMKFKTVRFPVVSVQIMIWGGGGGGRDSPWRHQYQYAWS